MRVKVNDITMAYQENGSGIPLLFIHGYPLNRRMWEPQINGLADVARVLAPDLRGHGESEAAGEVYTMDLLADDCNAFLNALGIQQPVTLCGLSMGGYIALAFQRRYPERLAGLILAATRAGADTLEGKASRDQAAALAQKEGLSAIAELMLSKMMSPKTYESRPDLVERVKSIIEANSIEGVVGDLMGMKERPDSTPTLPKIRVPTLILAGADDQIIPQGEAEAMKEAIPDAQLEVLPDSGHLLNLEQPDLFNQAVQRFMKKL